MFTVQLIGLIIVSILIYKEKYLIALISTIITFFLSIAAEKLANKIRDN